jgi:hypothetical protein
MAASRGVRNVGLLPGFSESELHAKDAVVPDTSVVPPPCHCFQSAGVTSVAEIENPHATAPTSLRGCASRSANA